MTLNDDGGPRCEEAYLTLSQAAALLPGHSSGSLWRWCRKGVEARSGGRVRLRHVRLGGRLYTRADWVDAFGAELAAADEGHFAEECERHEQSTNSSIAEGGST